MDQGVNQLGHIGPAADVNPTGLGMNNCNFTGDANFSGGDPQFPADPSCPASGSWLKTGRSQSYNLSVRGGAERINYFVSGRWGTEAGVFDTGYDGNGIQASRAGTGELETFAGTSHSPPPTIWTSGSTPSTRTGTSPGFPTATTPRACS